MVEKFEAKLFLNEKNKRIKQGLTWKKYAEQVLRQLITISYFPKIKFHIQLLNVSLLKIFYSPLYLVNIVVM